MPDELVAYQARVLHRLARRAAEQAIAARAAGQPEGEFATTALLVSATSLEAFLNELTVVAKRASNPPAHLVTFAMVMSELQAARAPIRSRFLVARSLLPGPPLLKNAQPYQDLDFLFTLRNHVVHLEPETVTVDANSLPKLQERLLARGLVTMNREVIMTTLARLGSAEVAKWACNVVAEVAGAFSLRDDQTPTPADELTYWLQIAGFERLDLAIPSPPNP